MSFPGKQAMALEDTSRSAPKSDIHEAAHQQTSAQRDDSRENAAKYRREVDELNRSRDSDIERALLRANR